jgi:hypothetical protein
MNHRRMLVTAALTAATALTLPAAAGAATATVTGDDGQGIALSPSAPTQIRNLSPVVIVGADPATETKYSIQVTGPDGLTVANVGAYCLNATSYTDPEKVKYLGNGTYTVTIKSGKGNCTDRTSTYTFAIAAGTAITAPTAKLLTRRAGRTDYITYSVPVAGNPGATDMQVRYAKNAVLQPDGSIQGTPSFASFNATNSTAAAEFFEPGTYTFVSRAGGYGGGYTAWSAPVVVKVLAPFDFSVKPDFIDSTGPRYSVSGYVREKSAAGKKITVSLAKGSKGGKFHRIAKVRVRKSGKFSVRFTIRQRGRYRMKYTYKTSSTVAGGYAIQKFKIKRRFF